jgi:hypothetical protein
MLFVVCCFSLSSEKEGPRKIYGPRVKERGAVLVCSILDLLPSSSNDKTAYKTVMARQRSQLPHSNSDSSTSEDSPDSPKSSTSDHFARAHFRSRRKRPSGRAEEKSRRTVWSSEEEDETLVGLGPKSSEGEKKRLIEVHSSGRKKGRREQSIPKRAVWIMRSGGKAAVSRTTFERDLLKRANLPTC